MTEAVTVKHTQVVIIGAGQAGVCLSHRLQQQGIGHVVLERDRPFKTFRGTWDSFRMNTQNFSNELPEAPRTFAPGQPRDAIATRADVIEYLDAYLETVDPPLELGTEVRRVARENGHWQVECADGRAWSSDAVACCVGISGKPKVPARLADALPDTVSQRHSSDYRRPKDIEQGTVVVVGSGASGTQIALDLATAGKQVFLACSDVPIVPPKLFGIVPTLKLMGWIVPFATRDSRLGRRMYAKMAGAGQATIPPGPKELEANHGVQLVGRLQAVETDRLRFDDDQIVELDDVAVLWCTGFAYDFSFLDLDDVEPHSEPDHHRGVHRSHPGLYFLGMKFLWRLDSHLIGGIGKDVAYAADHLQGYLAQAAN
jgi:putative flavoprotein involved in K+ transport